MEPEPILIHSLFRTGSTYVWNRLRQVPGITGFYEPFHPELAWVTGESPSPWRHDEAATDSWGHPRLKKSYLEEYRPLLRTGERGVPLYRTSFAFDDFLCRGEHPAQKQYLDSLVHAARPQRAVLQFNRSAMRVKWFRKYYPGALQVYMVRHPDHQFQSQFAIMQNLGLDTFPVMDLMAVAINRDTPEFAPLNRVIPLPCYRHPDFSVQRRFFSRAGSVLLPAERYALFYYLWFSALVENIKDPETILSIDALSLEPVYRRIVEQRFSGFTGAAVEFDDAAVRRYPHPPLEGEAARMIRRAVQALILGRGDLNHVPDALERLSPTLRSFLALSDGMPQAMTSETEPVIPGLRPPGQLRDAMTEVLGADLERHFEEKRLLHRLIRDASASARPAFEKESSQDVPPGMEFMELSKRISNLELELEESEQRAREQSVGWTRQVESAQKQLSELENELSDRAESLRRALAEKDAAREAARRLADQAHELSGKTESLRKELDALRSSRWYRWGKKLGWLRKAQ